MFIDSHAHLTDIISKNALSSLQTAELNSILSSTPPLDSKPAPSSNSTLYSKTHNTPKTNKNAVFDSITHTPLNTQSESTNSEFNAQFGIPNSVFNAQFGTEKPNSNADLDAVITSSYNIKTLLLTLNYFCKNDLPLPNNFNNDNLKTQPTKNCGLSSTITTTNLCDSQANNIDSQANNIDSQANDCDSQVSNCEKQTSNCEKQTSDFNYADTKVFCTLGIHPQYANEYTPKVRQLICQNSDKIVAIGEIGLDKVIADKTIYTQTTGFNAKNLISNRENVNIENLIDKFNAKNYELENLDNQNSYFNNKKAKINILTADFGNIPANFDTYTAVFEEPVYTQTADFVTQKKVLVSQLELARTLKKPVVCHVRESFVEFFEIMREFVGVPFMLHCFGGSRHDCYKALELGGYISFACNITYRRHADLRKLSAEIPLDKLLIETDSPSMPPAIFARKKPNLPANVRFVAETIAKARNISLEEIALATKNNAITFFKLGKNL